MNNRKHKILSGLAGFLMLLLIAPMVLHQFNLLKPSILEGAPAFDSSYVPLTFSNWMNDSFQSNVNTRVQNNIIVKPDLIRINNQLDFLLFKTIHANTVIGKNDNLLDLLYIKSYFGQDIKNNFSTDSIIADRVRKMKFIQTELEKRNKHLVVVYEPSKIRFMPEDIPDNLKWGANTITAYDTYLKWGKAFNLEYIDLNGWFVSLKGHSKHQLFAKPGIHWTNYGALIAADTLQKYMESKGKEHCALIWDDNEQGKMERPVNTENDLLKLLNLMSFDNRDTFFHPTVFFQPDHPKTTNTAIYVSDSFFWIWSDMYIPGHLHTSFQYWPYNAEVWYSDKPGPHPLSAINKMEECMNTDWIVLSFTEFNYLNYGFGIVDELYAYLNK